MAADICLIADAAEAYADILPLKCFCYALANAGLACSGRSYEEKDRTALLFVQVHDGDLLDDPFLHFFKAEMILLQHSFRLGKTDRSRIRRFPVQAGQKFQIIAQHSVFGASAAALLHAVQHLSGFRLGSLIHSALGYTYLQPSLVCDLFGMHIIQLLLEIFHLLFDRCLAVGFLVLFFLGIFCIGAKLCDLGKFVDRFFHQLHTFCFAVLLEEGISLFIRDGEPG